MNRTLIIVPGECDSLGGTLITLSSVLKGFEKLDLADQVLVLVRTGTTMVHYLTNQNQQRYIVPIESSTKRDFFAKALDWVTQQPIEWPLYLDNTVAKDIIPTLFKSSAKLRWSGRDIYHFFHDLALSYQPLGFVARKITFTLLSPKAICNSYFTAEHVDRLLLKKIRDILYQPIDLERFNPQLSFPSPKQLESVLQKGQRLILTPSRITEPGIVNDKNLLALIPVLEKLKKHGHPYHMVIIGEDDTPGEVFVQQLLAQIQKADVADYITILPPEFNIEAYYQFADMVVTLAPREPFGRVVVEAIACGVPVVGSNTGGIGEILKNFAPDWMVSPDDPDRIAETIVRVMNSPETDSTLLDAQKWVKENCDVTRYAAAIKKIVGL